ncbi:MAG: hypothetical protein NZ941_03840 [Candidatus Caldarchaeum sp.]|nr:hypothetical protein [Candidatus Caldarchaeum sp.]
MAGHLRSGHIPTSPLLLAGEGLGVRSTVQLCPPAFPVRREEHVDLSSREKDRG